MPKQVVLIKEQLWCMLWSERAQALPFPWEEKDIRGVWSRVGQAAWETGTKMATRFWIHWKGSEICCYKLMRGTPSLSQPLYSQTLLLPSHWLLILLKELLFLEDSKISFLYQHGGRINAEEKILGHVGLRLDWCKFEGRSQPTSPDWCSLQLQKHLFQFLKKKSETGC